MFNKKNSINFFSIYKTVKASITKWFKEMLRNQP